MSDVKVLSSETKFKGKLISVRVDQLEESGKKYSREIVGCPNAVCVVARPSPQQVILIRQYRHATGKTLIELPAGGLKPDEDPGAAAIRELEEETGYLASHVVERGGFWMTPGFTTEFMHIFEASGLTKTQINPDDDEVIEID